MHSRKQRYAIKLKTLTHYSTCEYPLCAHCGETDIRVLQLDHIAGGGAKHRRQINKRAGWSYYLWIEKEGYPEGFQVLCANCNIRKRYTMGEVVLFGGL